MIIFIPVFILFCKQNLKEIEFAAFLDILIDPEHECYAKAWYEFERRYRRLIFGRIHNQLKRWNRNGDLDLMADISGKVSERLTMNEFRIIKIFRARDSEGRFIKYLSIISQTTANAELKKYYSKKTTSLDDEGNYVLEPALELTENVEDVYELVVKKIRHKFADKQKSHFHQERDIFICTLRCIASFKSKEIAEIPLLKTKPHNVDVVVDRIKDLFEN